MAHLISCLFNRCSWGKQMALVEQTWKHLVSFTEIILCIRQGRVLCFVRKVGADSIRHGILKGLRSWFHGKRWTEEPPLLPGRWLFNKGLQTSPVSEDIKYLRFRSMRSRNLLGTDSENSLEGDSHLTHRGGIKLWLKWPWNKPPSDPGSGLNCVSLNCLHTTLSLSSLNRLNRLNNDMKGKDADESDEWSSC